MGEIYDKASTFESICESIRLCSKGLKWKDSVLSNFLHPCYAACAILDNFKKGGTYVPQRYGKFIVKEPKEREIYSTRFVDRVIQRSMLENGLYDLLTKNLIYDNFACQKGKGTEFAINRLKLHMLEHFKKHGNSGYVGQIDIRKFFPSIPHKVAKEAMSRRIKYDSDCLRFTHDLIDFFEDQSAKYGYDSSFGKRGIAPGSEFSQLVALNVLDPVDHFVKDELGIRHYLRYMDDIIFFHEDKETVKMVFEEIEDRISKLGLQFNSKSQVRPFKNGISFLKFNFRFSSSGRLVIKLNDQTKRRERRKLKAYKRMYDEKKIGIDVVYSNLMSWSDHIKHAQSGAIRKNLQEFAERIFSMRFFIGRSKIQKFMRNLALNGRIFPVYHKNYKHFLVH